MVNNLGLLFNIINTKHKSGTDVSDHVAQLESPFSHLASMASVVDNTTKVEILLPSFGNQEEYAPMISLVSTTQEETAKWEYDKTIFIEE